MAGKGEEVGHTPLGSTVPQSRHAVTEHIKPTLAVPCAVLMRRKAVGDVQGAQVAAGLKGGVSSAGVSLGQKAMKGRSSSGTRSSRGWEDCGLRKALGAKRKIHIWKWERNEATFPTSRSGKGLAAAFGFG